MGSQNELVDQDGNVNYNKHFHSIIMLYPEFKIHEKAEVQMFNQIFTEVTKRLGRLLFQFLFF
jgi:hypothetical protein